MKLSVLERILLLNLLPQKESIDVLKISKNLKEALSFTEEEHKHFEIKNEGGSIKWNPAKDEEKEIQIGEKATDICIKALKDADKEKLLTEQHISLYDKFVK